MRSATDLLKQETGQEEPEKQEKPAGTMEEDMRWARDRTGWAPQFVHETTEEEKAEGTLLDHQTFLEGKLDDKFFGGEKPIDRDFSFASTDWTRLVPQCRCYRFRLSWLVGHRGFGWWTRLDFHHHGRL